MKGICVTKKMVVVGDDSLYKGIRMSLWGI